MLRSMRTFVEILLRYSWAVADSAVTASPGDFLVCIDPAVGWGQLKAPLHFWFIFVLGCFDVSGYIYTIIFFYERSLTFLFFLVRRGEFKSPGEAEITHR